MSGRMQLMAGSAVAALLALAGVETAPAAAAPPVVKKVAAKKRVVARKPARKRARKPAVKTVIVYVPAPPVYVPAPPAPPAIAVALDPGFARYRYIDDADALLDTVGASPPDHGFRCNGAACWAWALSGGELVLAEPAGDRFRYYAFEAGALYPFFVGDGDRSYGFDDRTLAAVYDGGARLVDWRPGDGLAREAAWLVERGRALRAAAARRAPVIASDWAAEASYFGDIELRFGDWRGTPGWSRYRDGAGQRRHREWRARLGYESSRRRDRADLFERGRRDDDRVPPPARGGSWNTIPEGSGGAGGWTGRPRPAAPASPEAGRPDRRPSDRPRDDRWSGRSPVARTNPPAVAQPGTPSPVAGDPLPPPVVVAPRLDRGGGAAADRGPRRPPDMGRAVVKPPAAVDIASPAVATPTPPFVAPIEAAPPPSAPMPVEVAPPTAPMPVEAAPPPAPMPVEVAPPPPAPTAAAPPPPPPPPPPPREPEETPVRPTTNE